jgi:sugar phosphate isomerase/epimerase
MKAIKEAGYAQVELGDVMAADNLVALARENQLSVTSSFITWNTIAEENPKGVPTMAQIIDKATQHGLKHLVFGYIGKGFRETADQYKSMADRANAAAELCQTASIQLCYHNHSFEFAKLDNGQSGFEIFMERFAKPMKFELDIFWAAIGGWDPVETMEKLDGRISQLHLKDLKADVGTIYDEGKVPEDAFLEVGNGIIDMAKVIQMARKIGVEQCHVEQDQSPAPLKSIATSYNYLKKLEA